MLLVRSLTANASSALSAPEPVATTMLFNGGGVASVYAVSLAAVFGSSAVYHRGQ